MECMQEVEISPVMNNHNVENNESIDDYITIIMND